MTGYSANRRSRSCIYLAGFLLLVLVLGVRAFGSINAVRANALKIASASTPIRHYDGPPLQARESNDAERFLGADSSNLFPDSAPIGAALLLSGDVVAPNTTGGGGTEVVERAMSQAELGATRSTGLVRGGRDGTHYVSDAVNHDALRARQRLGLPQTPEVRVRMEVSEGAFSPPKKVDPAFNMPGGGMERTATGPVPCRVLCVWDY